MLVRYSCILLLFSQLFSLVLTITNNANLIWYKQNSDEPQYFTARQPIPDGLMKAQRIVVNQTLPLLWEVKFAFFDNLESLIIDHCGVNEIRPDSFKDLKPLTNLSLSHNNLHEIKSNVFNFVDVEHLNLSHNKIGLIQSDAFNNMPNLQMIILDFNELRFWDKEWFRNSTNIRKISITHNFLLEIPDDAFQQFKHHQNNNLLNIYFSYNKIKTIQKRGLVECCFNHLFLDWNDLTELESALFTEMDCFIKYLNLKGNSIVCVPNQVIIENRTEILNLEDNPISCECRKELQNENKDKQIEILIAADTNC